MLTIKDVMGILKVSRQTVYNLMLHKKLPHYKIGGAVRFKKSDVEKYIDSCKV